VFSPFSREEILRYNLREWFSKKKLEDTPGNIPRAWYRLSVPTSKSFPMDSNNLTTLNKRQNYPKAENSE
jgi:hypothetical protein